jgi:hypothetical protein
VTNHGSTGPVKRLFPFVSRARILIIGRDTLRRSKGKLHFVLITRDISENSRGGDSERFRALPGGTALHAGGTGEILRNQEGEGSPFSEVGPRSIHLCRVEAASDQQALISVHAIDEIQKSREMTRQAPRQRFEAGPAR